MSETKVRYVLDGPHASWLELRLEFDSRFAVGTAAPFRIVIETPDGDQKFVFDRVDLPNPGEADVDVIMFYRSDDE